MIELLADRQPFVAFVGAGASALPPSSLPTWTQFNNLLLECLCECLARYSRDRQPTDEMLGEFRARRDETRFLAPDFQAQLMEEEVGTDYFRVWQSLETDRFGPVHAGLAELASRNRLKAIITTNFDRLIETALASRGVTFRVFHDLPAFDSLAEVLNRSDMAVVPIIKIHGSIEDPGSLVDTLKQRLVGRPPALNDAFQVLLRRCPWLYLGFSGADFSYDPHYLGILDAAAHARGFVFHVRDEARLQDGVRLLAKAYGPEKAFIVAGDLSSWLTQTFALEPFQPSSQSGARPEPAMEVKTRIHAWVDTLGPMAVVNILYAMLKASGMEAQALWLARRTWKSYRTPEDTRSPSYARYNYNYGLSLFEVGFIRNPVDLADDISNLRDWKEHADENAFEFFARSYDDGKFLAAGAQLASVLAFRGEVGKAVSLAAHVTGKSLERDAKLEFCDVALACVPIYDIVRVFDPVAMQLRRCLEIAKQLGDEPRRAWLSVHLGRFLTYGGHFQEADQFIGEAERIAERLDLQPVLLACRAARGRWLVDSGTSDEQAVQTLQSVADAIHAMDEIPLFVKTDLLKPESAPLEVKGRHPVLCRVLLDLNRAARFAGNGDVMNQTLDELDVVATEIFPGYCPHYYLAYAECLMMHGSGDKRERIAHLISRAREVGRESKNPWVDEVADRYEEENRKAS